MQRRVDGNDGKQLLSFSRESMISCKKQIEKRARETAIISAFVSAHVANYFPKISANSINSTDRINAPQKAFIMNNRKNAKLTNAANAPQRTESHFQQAP